MTTQARPRPTGINRFETLAWQYTRWSGVLIIPLALVHLAIMHIINSVYVIDLDFVAARWSLLGWRLYDAGLLWFAGLHGLNGLRYVVDDYAPKRGVNRALKVVMVLVFAFIFVVGSVALIGGVGQP
jgi:succinate dehydrogenase / fumarate reductase membrane anchor subunit